MKAKRFSMSLIIISISMIVFFIAGNILFQKQFGWITDYRKGIFVTNLGNDLINKKTYYIRQKGLPYNAFILGGSKAGGLSPAKLKELTGLEFYNYWANVGTFDDYLTRFDYVYSIYNDRISHLILHLSSHEVEREKTTYDYMPPVIAKLNLNSSDLFLNNKKFFLDNLERFTNIHQTLELFEKKENITFTNSDGSRNFSPLKNKKSENSNEYIKTEVLNFWGKYDECLQKLFEPVEPELPACEYNIEILKKILAKCFEKNIKLTVIIGPTFISELYRYSSPKYIKYLEEIVSLTDVWNFSGINEINLNPDNFADGGHYFDFIGDKIIETVFSKGKPNTSNFDEFGILLTKENFPDFIESQKEKWQILKTEYEAFGKFSLK